MDSHVANTAQPSRVHGLPNVGSSCFAASVVQALLACEDFAGPLLSTAAAELSAVGRELRELALALGPHAGAQGAAGASAAFRALMRALGDAHISAPGEMMDAHEFLVVLLDALAASGSRRARTPPPPEQPSDRALSAKQLAAACMREFALQVQPAAACARALYGMQLDELECARCRRVTSARVAAFNALALPMQATLQAALDAAFEPEDEVYHRCPVCSMHAGKDSRVGEIVLRAPQVLVLVLQRFRLQGSAVAKAPEPVQVPQPRVELRAASADFRRMVSTRYALRAAVLHTGQSAADGHYMAVLALGPRGVCEQWVVANDARVSDPVPFETVAPMLAAAYMFFLERVPGN